MSRSNLTFVGMIYDYKSMGEEFDASLYYDPATNAFVVIEVVESDKPPNANHRESDPIPVETFIEDNPDHAAKVKEMIASVINKATAKAK